MFSNQLVSASRMAALACLLALDGCSVFGRGPAPQPTTQIAAAPAPAETAASTPQTVTEAATADDTAADENQAVATTPGSTTTVLGDATAAVKASAPKSYVVKRGDTLWGIANMFLRNPWQWPEIWYVNPQIANPHLIYPGDTVQLAYGSDGKVQSLQLVRGNAVRLSPLLRSTPLEGPIATIPYAQIAAFLSHPGVLTREQVKQLPYVLALRNDHVIAGTGFDLYVRKLDAQAGARYNVMHVDQPLKDPETGRLLGYMGIYTATAQVVEPGRITKVVLTQSSRETLQGDVLVPADVESTADFVPHPPTRAVSGQIIAVVDNVLLAGPYEVVALNRGTRDGLERGNVLTIDEAVRTVADRCAKIDARSDCLWHQRKQTLPTETAGDLLVFKTYDRMSYALVVGETSPVHVGDHIRNP